MSKKVYPVFKRGWGLYTYLSDICADLFEAIEDYIEKNNMENFNIAVTVMPSHSKGKHGDSLLKVTRKLVRKFDYLDASNLIQRIKDKTKLTKGGLRTIGFHLETLGLAGEIDNSVDIYIILDDITTTGSSLEAAKQLLIQYGAEEKNIIKIAVAKTMYVDDCYL